MKLFEKEYDGESIVDMFRDVSESVDSEYNPIVGTIPTDEHGFQKGSFKVTIEWVNNVESI